jgi:transposase
MEVVHFSLPFLVQFYFTSDKWLAKYREGGVEALRSRKASGRPAKLSGKDLQRIYRVVVGKDPSLHFSSIILER